MYISSHITTVFIHNYNLHSLTFVNQKLILFLFWSTCSGLHELCKRALLMGNKSSRIYSYEISSCCLLTKTGSVPSHILFKSYMLLTRQQSPLFMNRDPVFKSNWSSSSFILWQHNMLDTHILQVSYFIKNIMFFTAHFNAHTYPNCKINIAHQL